MEKLRKKNIEHIILLKEIHFFINLFFACVFHVVLVVRDSPSTLHSVKIEFEYDAYGLFRREKRKWKKNHI